MNLTRIALFCVSLVSAAVLYDLLTSQIPSRLRPGDQPSSHFGVVRADELDSPGRAHGIDIIFVHGLGSNPDTTWGPKDKNWVNHFLPEDIPVEAQSDIRIFFYNYDSYWKRDAVQTRLWRLGKGLLDRIGSEIRATEGERTRSLAFVGHSYGGLVIKQALILAHKNKAYNHVSEHTKSVFFLGTPHRGSSFSMWGSIAARVLQPLGSNPALLQEVEYDSLSLLELHEEFEHAVSEKLRVINFFEQRKTRLLRVWFFQWEEFCVREQSATYGRVENIGLAVDHYGLNKFASKDGNYRQILGKLVEIITPIVSHQPVGLFAVPASTVGTYTERDSLSAEVDEKLCVRHQNASVPHALAIYGLGGAGKTQLALKYAESHRTEYNPILWIDARDEESVRSSYERCASELELPVDRGATQSAKLADAPAVQAVLRWLRGRKDTDDRWLVIFDNVDDLSWGIKGVLPRGSQGSIITTSQDSLSWKLVDGGCEKVHVDVMEPTEARHLLLRHLNIDLDPVPEKVLEDCDKIVKQLGYLALAIDLAGAYIGNEADQRQALGQYLADYEKHRDDLLQSEQFRGLSASDKTVWTVWDTTLERIERTGKDRRPGMLLAFLTRFRSGAVEDEVFRLASLALAAADQEVRDEEAELPPWLLTLLASDGNGWDDFHYRKTCDILVRYSLIQRKQGLWGGVSMHGLVQWRASKFEQEMAWDCWHVVIVAAACRRVSSDKEKPEFRRYIVTHIPNVGRGRLSEMGFGEEGMVSVWKAAREVYFEEGWWSEAEKLDMQVMETRKTQLGDDHPYTLTSMANLALTYWNQGLWDKAEELFVQVMETSKTKLGDGHSSTLTSMANLAFTWKHRGRDAEAIALMRECVQSRYRKLGANHPDFISSSATLAEWEAEQTSAMPLADGSLDEHDE